MTKHFWYWAKNIHVANISTSSCKNNAIYAYYFYEHFSHAFIKTAFSHFNFKAPRLLPQNKPRHRPHALCHPICAMKLMSRRGKCPHNASPSLCKMPLSAPATMCPYLNLCSSALLYFMREIWFHYLMSKYMLGNTYREVRRRDGFWYIIYLML